MIWFKFKKWNFLVKVLVWRS